LQASSRQPLRESKIFPRIQQTALAEKKPKRKRKRKAAGTEEDEDDIT
jgi:hypothetical protein